MWYGSQISWTRGLKNAFEDFWQCLILYNMAIAVTYKTITERILPDTETIFLPGSNPLRVEVRLIVMGMKSKYSAKMFNVSVTFLFHHCDGHEIEIHPKMFNVSVTFLFHHCDGHEIEIQCKDVQCKCHLSISSCFLRSRLLKNSRTLSSRLY